MFVGVACTLNALHPCPIAPHPQALQKTGKTEDRVEDYVLVEDVHHGWDKIDVDRPGQQSIVNMSEKLLDAQNQWKGAGKFILRKKGDVSPPALLSLYSAYHVKLHTRSDGQMSREHRLYISRFGRSVNPNLTDLNPGRVKPMTLILICVTSWPGARHY